MMIQITNKADLEERPLVTLALFAYNQEGFIREAIEGALAQDYSPLEIIISDDCSTDRTFDIIQEVIKDYSGQHSINLNRNSSNLGIGHHVNKINELAQGELIIAAAGDDISLDRRITVLVERWLAEGKPSAICSQAYVISSNGELISDRFTRYDGTYPALGESRLRAINRLVAQDHCILLGCTEAWRPEVFRLFGPLNKCVIHEDNVISLRAWLIDRIVFINEPLVKYRTHEFNVAYRAQRIPISIADFKRRELEVSKKHQAKIINLHQYATDIKTAIDQNIIGRNEFPNSLETINSRIEYHTVLGMWWEYSFSKRVWCLIKFVKRSDFVAFFWGFPRVFNLNIFSCGRAFLAFMSRLRRSIMAFFGIAS